MNGEIVNLARELGAKSPQFSGSGFLAPVNDKIVQLVQAAENKRAGSPMLQPSELRRALGVPAPFSTKWFYAAAFVLLAVLARLLLLFGRAVLSR